ncbi:unnamed protein product [Bathycoccus prasinos]
MFKSSAKNVSANRSKLRFAMVDGAPSRTASSLEAFSY